MPRTARLRIEGFPFHIVQRGHNKAPCFLEASDYELYLGLLGEFARRCACRVHAYVLMTNHVHLLVTSREAWGSTRLMRHVNQHYVQRFNRRYGRCGSAWQGRFWSSVVESDSYLLTCQRYIELNPVRAGMVGSPGDYRWSSHAHNAAGAPSLVVTPHEHFLALGGTEASRRRAYLNLCEDQVAPEDLKRIRDASRANRPLGSDGFLEELRLRFGLRTSRGKPGPQPRRKRLAP